MNDTGWDVIIVLGISNTHGEVMRHVYPTEREQLPKGELCWDLPLVRMGKSNLLHVLAKCGTCRTEWYVPRSETRRPNRPRTGQCLPCRTHEHYKSLNGKGKNSSRYKGLRRHDGRDGYIMRALYPGDPWYEEMGIYAQRRGVPNSVRYVREHRWIMANHVGRRLNPWEHVHHKNGVKDDNRLENLELVNGSTHAAITALEAENARLRSEVARLQELVDTLQSQRGQ